MYSGDRFYAKLLRLVRRIIKIVIFKFNVYYLMLIYNINRFLTRNFPPNSWNLLTVALKVGVFKFWRIFFELAHFNKIQYFPGISFLMFHKPFLGSLQIPHKIWALSIQPFWRVYKQKTNKHPHKQVYIYRCTFLMREHVLAAF